MVSAGLVERWGEGERPAGRAERRYLIYVDHGDCTVELSLWFDGGV